MTKKEKKKENDDVIFEEIREEKSSFKKKDKKNDKYDECKKERQEYLDGWQRARAEIVNLKKQHQDEKKLFTSIGKEKMLEELLPVLDNFEAAFGSESWEKVDQNWRVGIEYIHKQFLDILENNGIQEFGNIDDELDFEKYEVVEEVENKDRKGMIVKIIQKGFKQGDKILRPAKVQVGK